MLVIPYDRDKHESSFQTLFALRDMDPHLTVDLPQYGLIAMDGNTIVAAGFLRGIEGPYAMMDSFITNPNSSSDIRSKALDLIMYKLIKVAKHNGVNTLLGFTEIPTIFDRTVAHGFRPLDHKMIIRPL